MRCVWATGLLAVLSFAPGLAQESSTAVLGESIRVRSHFGRIEAQFERLSNDTLVLNRRGNLWYITPVDSIRSVEARRCCRTRGAGRTTGAILGGLVGTAVGVGSAFVACGSDRYVCDSDDPKFRGSLVIFVLSRSLLGAIAGAVWGHFRPGDAWKPVVLPEVTVGSTWEGAPRFDLAMRVVW